MIRGHNITTTTMPNSMKKHVSFHQIEIREHCRTLGDNPSVSKGPALAIDWESCDLGSVSLDDYERLRPPRRTKTELAVPCHVRETMLRHDAGITRGDMAAASRQRERVRQRARRNHNEVPALPLRALQKLLKGGNSSSSTTMEAATQRQVDELMELSRRVEHEREQQRQAYMAQVMQELSAQHQQQQPDEPDHQVPGQSTREEEKKESTTPQVTASSNDLQKNLERSPSFLPNQEHADSWDDQSTDHFEF